MQTTSQWDKREVVIKERGDERVEDGSLIGRHKDGEEERWGEKKRWSGWQWQWKIDLTQGQV